MTKSLKKLITSTCANYIDGNCILLDKECPLISGGTYRNKEIPASDCSCTYFEKSVLPANKTLEAIYYGKETVLNKLCKGAVAKALIPYQTGLFIVVIYVGNQQGVQRL